MDNLYKKKLFDNLHVEKNDRREPARLSHHQLCKTAAVHQHITFRVEEQTRRPLLLPNFLLLSILLRSGILIPWHLQTFMKSKLFKTTTAFGKRHVKTLPDTCKLFKLGHPSSKAPSSFICNLSAIWNIHPLKIAKKQPV